MQLHEVLECALSPEELLARVNVRMGPERRALGKKAALLRARFPAQVDKALEKAGLALQDMVVLPGTMGKPYFAGDPPRWYANPVNDNEYTWQLNRMGHWETLLWAYALTQDDRYAGKVVSELLDWIENCPRPKLVPQHYNAVNPWRSLEVGIRMFRSWPAILAHLAGTRFLTPGLMERLAVSLYEHGQVLAEISPAHFPHADHNHYVMEMLGLLVLSCILSEIKEADEWRALAMRDLERCAVAQITEGGGQVEGCPGYHGVCVHLFMLSILVARKYGLAFSDAYLQRVRRLLDYSVQSFRPSGTMVPWGDSSPTDGAVFGAIEAYAALQAEEPLRITTSLAGKPSAVRYVLDNFPHIPDPQKTLAFIDSLDSGFKPLPLVSWQKELGQVLMRTDWTAKALSVFFACRTPVYGGHSHIDPLGFDLTALGKPLIVDPGAFCYREDEDRRLFKSAAWHSTLLINDQDPFRYISSWRYGRQEEGTILNVWQRDGLVAAEAMHRNYEPAICRRVLALVEGRFVLILDQVTAVAPNASVQLYYHLDSLCVASDCAANCAFTSGDTANIALFATPNLSARLLPGRVAERTDVAHDSTRVRFEDSSQGQTERAYATVIVPYGASTERPEVTSLSIAGGREARRCRFTLDGEGYCFAWTSEGFERCAEAQP